ncbi:hypothetical protein HYT25_03140 [Candidatus Pacearchaeota archaeon]|nr:hypothetical protein [Candidatus Pacearchaeota archaeon]
MPPTIEISEEVLQDLNAKGIPYVLKESEKFLDSFIYIPELKLRFAKQRTLKWKDWFETHNSLKLQSNRMSRLPEFVEFLKYVKINNRDIYNEITQVMGSWRGEWIDAYFEKRKDGMYLLTENRTKAEKLDEDTLMKDKRISLDSWLDNPTKQGLPRKDTKEGDLYFVAPGNDSVAGFGAIVEGADLNCLRNPDYRDSYLGVRAVSE